jgi:ribosomal protein L16 Arg81 hydroxylase
VRPGDVLFIPVGWWHWVESLSPSVSVSFVNFSYPNTFDWNLT